MAQYKPSAQEIMDRKSYGQGSRARFDPQWAMSRPRDWYQNKNNLGLIKDTLVRQPAVTTDQNESRNMYQMLMNQIHGGGGAQLIDTSGLPAGARRTGRTLFTDPAKSQGFLRDVGSLFTGKNQAAVRAPIYNPFPNFGQAGKDWYKKEFGEPWGKKLSGIMKLALPGPLKFMAGKEKEIIPRDPRFSPENNPWGLPWELLEDEKDEIIEDEIIEDTPLDLSYEPATIWGPEGDPSIMMAGMEPFDDITEKIVQEGVNEDTIEETFSDPELQDAKFDWGNLGTEDYSPWMDLNINQIQNPANREAAKNAAIRFNMAWKQGNTEDYELEELYQDYLDAIEAGKNNRIDK